MSFDGVLVIALVAVAVPLLLALVPRLPVPGAVLEVVAGILIGPAVLGWVHLDAPIGVLSDLGLGMLLFLAGLEIDVGGLRGPLGRLAGWAFAASVLLGLACGYAFSLAGVGGKPVFLAVVLTSTSAGLLLPLLKDAGLHRAPFGQLVMAAAALAEIVPVMMLSLLFSATAGTSAGRLGSLALFLGLLAIIGLALGRIRSLAVLDRLLDRLEDRSAQLRVRAALTLALAFAVLANRFGFASILGAFAAGLLVRTIEQADRTSHPQFQVKLEGIGFGFLVPVFFITTGVQFDVRALVSNVTALAEVPLLLAALLIVRGVPALFYVRLIGRPRAGAAGLMQATTLTFVIVASQIGIASGQVSRTTGAALLAAGLLSAALFPAVSLRLLPAGALDVQSDIGNTGLHVVHRDPDPAAAAVRAGPRVRAAQAGGADDRRRAAQQLAVPGPQAVRGGRSGDQDRPAAAGPPAPAGLHAHRGGSRAAP
jgi:Kef-type K+ transport system membrane component KefB